MPGTIHQRSISLFGLSIVTLTFEDTVDVLAARQQIVERMADADRPPAAAGIPRTETLPLPDLGSRLWLSERAGGAAERVDVDIGHLRPRGLPKVAVTV